MKCGPCKKARGCKTLQFWKKEVCWAWNPSLPLIRRRKDISRGADESRERKRGQCESPFKGCANIKPNNLKPVQEGIKATCYFEWLLNLLSCSEIWNEIQPLQLITSCCNWTSTIKEYFSRVFLERRRIFCLCGAMFLSTRIFPGNLFFFFFLRGKGWCQ